LKAVLVQVLFGIVHLNIFAADKIFVTFDTLTLYGANLLSRG
jgi:hypothetical protein